MPRLPLHRQMWSSVTGCPQNSKAHSTRLLKVDQALVVSVMSIQALMQLVSLRQHPRFTLTQLGGVPQITILTEPQSENLPGPSPHALSWFRMHIRSRRLIHSVSICRCLLASDMLRWPSHPCRYWVNRSIRQGIDRLALSRMLPRTAGSDPHLSRTPDPHLVCSPVSIRGLTCSLPRCCRDAELSSCVRPCKGPPVSINSALA